MVDKPFVFKNHRGEIIQITHVVQDGKQYRARKVLDRIPTDGSVRVLSGIEDLRRISEEIEDGD